jgi:hypothetical protein
MISFYRKITYVKGGLDQYNKPLLHNLFYAFIALQQIYELKSNKSDRGMNRQIMKTFYGNHVTNENELQ